MAFVKLDCGALDSSLWSEPSDVVKVFFTMLLMCDSEGLCPATAPGIASRANLPLAQVRDIIARLESPDSDDRSGVEEGRRIKRVPGGYQVINYLSYRDKDHGAAERARRYRERKRQAQGVTRNVTTETRNVTQGEAEGEADNRSTPPPSAVVGGDSKEGGPKKNPLVNGRRPDLEIELGQLVRREANLTDRDPIEVMAEVSHYEGARRTAVNPSTMSDDRLLNSVIDARSRVKALEARHAKR